MSDSESEEPEEEVADEETEQSGLGDGDFVELDYTARTVEDGTLVDTTDPEIAEEEGVDEEGRTFEPQTIVVGAGHLFEPVEDALAGGEVGDSGEVVVEAAEAFGEYDDEEVRTISAEKIDEDDRYPGAHVQVDGQEGHVETIIGGRARVDFNHPLAGEDVEYEYEIVDVIEDREEKATALLATYLDMELEVDIETDEVEELQPVETEDDDEDDEEPSEPEYEEVTVEKETLYVESTPQLSFNQQWMFQKQQIAQELMDRVDVDRVIIQEIIDGGGMGGMMGGMGGMMPGMGGGGDVEEALDEADVDADELVEELEGGEE
jgi:FKBP-type peptidyl-prolyl cis-trans isomerase SlyD